jgi:hypothetical protein
VVPASKGCRRFFCAPAGSADADGGSRQQSANPSPYVVVTKLLEVADSAPYPIRCQKELHPQPLSHAERGESNRQPPSVLPSLAAVGSVSPATANAHSVQAAVTAGTVPPPGLYVIEGRGGPHLPTAWLQHQRKASAKMDFSERSIPSGHADRGNPAGPRPCSDTQWIRSQSVRGAQVRHDGRGNVVTLISQALQGPS